MEEIRKEQTFQETAGQTFQQQPDQSEQSEQSEQSDRSDKSEQSDRSAEYVTRAEVEEMLRSAYLAGKNEAVRAQIAEDSTIRRRSKEPTTTVEDILSGMRRSVWE